MTPRSPGALGYRLAKAVLAPAVRGAFRVEIDGAAHVPDGGMILAANHRSFMDSVLLAAATPRPVSFLAKAEYFERRWTAWAFRATGQIPLRRGSPAGARGALEAALGVLGRGGTVGVYPEGTRSRDGLLHRGRLGPVRLAVASGAPIVPVGLVGTDAVQAPGQLVPRPGRPVTVRFGMPWHVLADTPATRAQLRHATDRLMRDISQLSGQTYAEDLAKVAPT